MRENVAGPGPARVPSPVTAAYLERAALHYLERYSASSEMLRRTLTRRVLKRARARGEEADAFDGMIEAVVRKAVEGGLVDDARFAAARLATLRRRGTSRRGVAAKLAAKGVALEVIEGALQAEESEASAEDTGTAELAAAHALARRRRLGPYRLPEKRAEHRERDLAAMARAGFRYGLARTVIDAEE